MGAVLFATADYGEHDIGAEADGRADEGDVRWWGQW